MAKPASNLRLFVAIYPPAELARQLIEALSRCELPAHRLVPEGEVHMTLQFIGDTPARELDATVESVMRAAGGLTAFDLRPIELIALPERGPARLVAVQTNSPPQLLELQRRLAARLAQNIRRKPGDRFRPHLTLCRFKSPGRVKLEPEPVEWPAFNVARITLMRSTLAPDGARHHPIAAAELR